MRDRGAGGIRWMMDLNRRPPEPKPAGLDDSLAVNVAPRDLGQVSWFFDARLDGTDGMRTSTIGEQSVALGR